MAVEVISQIEIKNNPTLPVVAQSRIVGGTGWLVADNTARDAIDVSSREVGMEVKVLSPLAYFKLEADLTTWTEVVFTGFVETADIGTTVPPLVDGRIPQDYIQSIFLNNSTVDASEAAMLARTTLTGDFSIRTDNGNVYVKLNNNGPTSVIGDWQVLNSPGVSSVNGQTGGVDITFETLRLYSTSNAEFQAAVSASTYAGVVDAALLAINNTLGGLGTDNHTHANLATLDGIINTGAGLKYLSDNGTYVTLHVHTNISALDKVIDSGDGTIFLANDGNYKALPAGLGDAPSDGVTYARKDAAWVNASIPGNQFEMLISDGAGGVTSSQYITAYASGRVQVKKASDGGTTNYDGDGFSTFNLAGNASLIELKAISDTEVIFAMGDFSAPDVWISTTSPSFGFTGGWINTGFEFGIGTSTPVVGATLDVGGTSSLKIPVGTAAQRAATGVTGMIRFNTDRNQFEVRGSLLNQDSSYSRIGEHPHEMTISGEGTIAQSSTNTQSFNLTTFKTADGAVELRLKFIAYDTTNDLTFTGEYVALYKDIVSTATQIGSTSTVYQITDDGTNPPVVTLDANGGNARITINFGNPSTPTRSYKFYYEGIFRYNEIKTSA